MYVISSLVPLETPLIRDLPKKGIKLMSCRASEEDPCLPCLLDEWT